MSKLRCAVLGVGYLGRFHAQKYANLEQVDFRGVYDIYAPQAQKIAEEFSVECFSSLNHLVEQVDAVSIAASTPAHFHLAKFCLENSIHVLIEKPITETLEEADELIELADKNGLILQVGHLERCNPAYENFLSHLSHPQLIEAQRLATFKKRGSEVDVILDLMIHDLDIILSWIKSPLVHIHGKGVSMVTDSIDLATVVLSFENGSCAQLTASRVHHTVERLTRVYQDKDYFSLNYQTQTLTKFKANPHEELGHLLEETEYASEKQDALMRQIKGFIAHIQGKKFQYVVDGRAARAALALAIEIQNTIQEVNYLV